MPDKIVWSKRVESRLGIFILVVIKRWTSELVCRTSLVIFLARYKIIYYSSSAWNYKYSVSRFVLSKAEDLCQALDKYPRQPGSGVGKHPEKLKGAELNT